MKQQFDANKLKSGLKCLIASLSLLFIIFFTSCNQLQSPKPEPFIGENTPPPKQEFRWSNGNLPKSFDPAKSAASPETDIVRAIYEGLVEIDPKSLKPLRAVATKWTASENNKTWTFELRQNAKWSNGETVTAEDFVRSWKRLTELGNKVTQRSLLKNIVGMDTEDVFPVFADDDPQENEKNADSNTLLNQKLQLDVKTNKNSSIEKIKPELTINSSEGSGNQKSNRKGLEKNKKLSKFGVEAIGKFTLRISLIHPDSELPLLIAHPIFRPVYGEGKEFEKNELDKNIVTNGPFQLQTISKEGITLKRSQNYWNKDAIKLEIVKFIPSENAEQALAAYKAGEVDVVTNVNFKPLALKLLEPFKKEFHQTTHSALNFYEFNLKEKPFNDNRVREALAISIEREKLTEDELDGATVPAIRFLPFEEGDKSLNQNVEKARKLLSDAGFEKGENFPTIKLVINRNNIQQRIANSIVKMWEKNLNIKSEVIVKNQAEIEDTIQTGDFSLVRRGVVLPTNNETSNMLSMFENRKNFVPEPKGNNEIDNSGTNSNIENRNLRENNSANSNIPLQNANLLANGETQNEEAQAIVETPLILTEDQALEQLPAIPLYFPTSYSLVKPYIQGFDLNGFDANSLKNVQIDSNWQPASEINTSKK